MRAGGGVSLPSAPPQRAIPTALPASQCCRRGWKAGRNTRGPFPIPGRCSLMVRGLNTHSRLQTLPNALPGAKTVSLTTAQSPGLAGKKAGKAAAWLAASQAVLEGELLPTIPRVRSGKAAAAIAGGRVRRRSSCCAPSRCVPGAQLCSQPGWDESVANCLALGRAQVCSWFSALPQCCPSHSSCCGGSQQRTLVPQFP